MTDAMDTKAGHSVPVTIITGFLGAGKSTLIKRILEEYHGLRIAVVENEFGNEVGIEDAIVTSGLEKSLVAAFVELPNGCLCCTIKDDLVDALSRLVVMCMSDETKRFDRIVIECSGLADPAPIVGMFWCDEALEMHLKLDGVITLVDGTAVLDRRKNQRSEFVKQIALADKILVNKMDIIHDVNPSDVEALEAEIMLQIREWNHTSPVEFCAHCQVNLEELLDIESLERVSENTFLDHQHSDVSTITITFSLDKPFDEGKLNHVLGDLLWTDIYEDDPANCAAVEAKMEIWRVKGLVMVSKQETDDIPTAEWCILQAVDTIFEVKPWDASSWLQTKEHSSKSDPLAASRVVFIGKNLDKHRIESSLASACK